MVSPFATNRAGQHEQNFDTQELLGHSLAVKSSGDQVAIHSVLNQLRRVLDAQMFHHCVFVERNCAW
jgi:hypothetical protein